jgi:Zn finger protein HypA/HybF involved in hydrogenase expression
MSCKGNHTSYNPTDEEFRCPKCGASHPDFYIEENESETDGFNCRLLHNGDFLRCDKCDFTIYGQEFVKELLEIRSLKVCPYCDGKGKIQGLNKDMDPYERACQTIRIWKSVRAVIDQAIAETTEGVEPNTSQRKLRSAIADIISQAHQSKQINEGLK